MTTLRGSTHKDEQHATGSLSLVRQLSGQIPGSQRSWVEKTFHKRECCKFIASLRDPGKCCCGRNKDWHDILPNIYSPSPVNEKWHPYGHTESCPTNAYGTIEFQGAPHPSKAQYVRLSSFDTKPEQVLQLLQKHWALDFPKLLITVHGGILNFDLQPKLKRVFRKGLLKAAKTTGAWIITGGTNTGVTRHVGDTISDRTTKLKNKVVAIGIAPWGIVENKEDLIGKDKVVPYHCVSSPKTNYAVLNSNHSYFLLVDNGTVGKYGGEIIFRKRLEKYIAQQKISIASGVKGRGVPVICVVLEGGANTIRSVLEYVTDSPPVPVVVCDGSGRAADLLAFTHKYTLEDGTMPESLRDQLILTIQKTFQYSQEQAEKLFIELMLCIKKKELITVFRMGEGAQDIDLAILTALLKGTNASAPDQLSLALTWDRVDIARSHIFVYGQEWPEGSLEQAMMDALINDRVDFVKLLLENGVSMQTFLTIQRLEELYNTRHGPSNTLRYLVRDIKKHVPSNYRYNLIDIGAVIEHLMDGAFRASYCRKRFRQKYNAIKRNGVAGNMGNLVTTLPMFLDTKEAQELFPYPFHDLMIWAVLMKRQKMALFMWQHGEEAMAKALMACKLYKAMSHEADSDDLEVDISDELRSYAKEFQVLALELLEHCYKIDDDYTQQLLTYELKNFSDQTCLSLAVAANHREFVAHTCCQILLNDMWMGGLQMRKNSSLKVILGILIPPYILALEFKSKEELQLMPQTMEEHLDELENQASEEEGDLSFSEDINEDHVNENLYIDDVNIETSFHSSSQGFPRENGSLHNDSNQEYSQFTIKKKKSPLRLGKRIYEFYNAPITKFWFYTMAYLGFLICYTYVVLVKTSPHPRWQEYLVMCYMFTLAIEKIRQVIASEPVKIRVKLRVHFSQLWNVWDSIGVVLFTVAVMMRHFQDTTKNVRVLYTINIVFWYIRILEILSVNKYLGPYVKIIGKLLRDMSYFIIILLIVLMSFGIVRQAIHFQDEEPSLKLVRNMFFYPYWMIYGELFADEIDTCTDVQREGCTYGSWVAPALMCVYLLVTNILLVNLLIARFNATFIKNNANSREIWKFQRYQLIINYELRPILPPPLLFFSHIFLAFKFMIRRCKGKRDMFDNGLKLFLSLDDTEKLHDFEEECIEDYFREKEHQFQSSNEERIRVINERVENMTLRMDDVNQKENSIKLSLQTVEYRLSKLEEISLQSADTLNSMRNLMARGVRHISASSATSSHGRLGSQDSIVEVSDLHLYETPCKTEQEPTRSQGVDRLSESSVVTPDANSTMRSIPSPLLIHSKKPVKEEHMHRYTDFTKPATLQKSGSGHRSLDRTQSQKSRSSLPRVTETSPESKKPEQSILKEKSLQQRRKGGPGGAKLIVDIDKANISSTEDLSQNANKPRGILVREHNVMDSNQSAAVYTTAKLVVDTKMSTGQKRNNDMIEDMSDEEQQEISSKDPPIITTSLSSSPVRSSGHGATAMYTVPSSMVAQLTPILTSLRSEYTTITDEIDTSCMMDKSPPGSPSTAGAFFDGKFDCGKKNSIKLLNENALLKQAEEVGHKRMEKVIRHRLRQISLDENDSISDIAKLVVSEMNLTEEEEHSGQEEESENNRSHHGSAESVIMGHLTTDMVEIRIRRASTEDKPDQTV
ncbi:LOW QUALITY PROTEIN: transient receptor potential cation channel subfamily M member 3-like [Pecten maximus]|uniref:LOW QUALITY PROTEIN: transient receptor potential cation channel subfamily M member 3-like n=1 Tax=Pecten maximus TaxID=6579 RepID=UPI0014589327|nr:LOW QUALITY PROTEIN: transient receptor potential cation channel subfamily M member 3-like [Pecten maximus]